MTARGTLKPDPPYRQDVKLMFAKPSFRDFQFSDFPISDFRFPDFRFSDFRFPISQANRQTDFPKFPISDFPISDFPISAQCCHATFCQSPRIQAIIKPVPSTITWTEAWSTPKLSHQPETPRNRAHKRFRRQARRKAKKLKQTQTSPRMNFPQKPTRAATLRQHASPRQT